MFATALRLAAPCSATAMLARSGRRGVLMATVAAYSGPGRSDLLDAVEQERKRVEVKQFAVKFPLLGDLAAGLSDKYVSSMNVFDTPFLAEKEYWTWDRDLASRRETLLLSALKLVCGSAENDADLQASARLLQFYGVGTKE